MLLSREGGGAGAAAVLLSREGGVAAAAALTRGGGVVVVENGAVKLAVQLRVGGADRCGATELVKGGGATAKEARP